jgi:hypothetical protein
MAGVPAHATPASPHASKQHASLTSHPKEKASCCTAELYREPPLAVSTSCVLRAHGVAASLRAVARFFAGDDWSRTRPIVEVYVLLLPLHRGKFRADSLPYESRRIFCAE